MKVDNSELLAVCLAMLMLVLLPTGLLIGSTPLAAAAGLALAGAVGRRARLAARPDPWRTFDRALSEMGVVVADRGPVTAAEPPHGAPAQHGRRITPRRR